MIKGSLSCLYASFDCYYAITAERIWIIFSRRYVVTHPLVKDTYLTTNRGPLGLPANAGWTRIIDTKYFYTKVIVKFNNNLTHIIPLVPLIHVFIFLHLLHVILIQRIVDAFVKKVVRYHFGGEAWRVLKWEWRDSKLIVRRASQPLKIFKTRDIIVQVNKKCKFH